MPTTEERAALRQALDTAGGPGPATTLMELVGPMERSQIATKSDLAETTAALGARIERVGIASAGSVEDA